MITDFFLSTKEFVDNVKLQMAADIDINKGLIYKDYTRVFTKHQKEKKKERN